MQLSLDKYKVFVLVIIDSVGSTVDSSSAWLLISFEAQDLGYFKALQLIGRLSEKCRTLLTKLLRLSYALSPGTM